MLEKIADHTERTYADAAVISLVAVNSIIYLFAIGDGGLWLDEVLWARGGYSILSGNPYVNPANMFAPVGKYVIGVGQLLFGHSSFGARFGVVFVSALSPLSIYYVSRSIKKPWAGVLSVVSLYSIPLFAAYSSSAMLDITLVSSVTILNCLVVLQHKTQGSKAIDVCIGAFIIITSASKAYGVLYVIGPSIAYLSLRYDQISNKKLFVRTTIPAVVSFAILYLPFLLVAPPSYYGGADIPDVARAVFQVPVIGGPAYAFAASLYFNITGHPGGEPTLDIVFTWFSHGGPTVIVGALIGAGAYRIPSRYRVGPWWLTTTFLVLPVMLLWIFLPKRVPKYILPLFPTAVLYGTVFYYEVIKYIVYDGRWRQIATVFVVLIVMFPAAPLLLGPMQLSADSQYDSASEFLASQADNNITAVAPRSLVLWWYFSDRYVESFNFDQTEPRQFRVNGREITVMGTATKRPNSYTEAQQNISSGHVDYVVLIDGRGLQEFNISNCGRMVRSWFGYTTAQHEPDEISVWRVSNC